MLSRSCHFYCAILELGYSILMLEFAHTHNVFDFLL